MSVVWCACSRSISVRNSDAVRRSESRRSVMSLKNGGTKKIARKVAASIPPMTPVPTERRAPAPAPAEIARGSTPKMNASEVIRMGRKRSRAASSAAAAVDRPSWCFSTAYSTIRMAFFAARPSSVTSPIWKYTSLVNPRSHTAASAPKVPNGSASRTDSGSDHFSYCAARIRNTIRAASASAMPAVPHHLALLGPHVNIADLVGAFAVGGLGRHQHLPGASVLVEVVDVVGAGGRGERPVKGVDRHAERLGLVAVQVHVELRHARAPESIDETELRLLACTREELLQHL